VWSVGRVHEEETENPKIKSFFKDTLCTKGKYVKILIINAQHLIALP